MLYSTKLNSSRERVINDDWVVETNTGMSCVVPAWKIAELLFMEELVAIRKEIEEKVDEEKAKKPGFV